MPTVARYTNPKYCLSYGNDDVIFLEVVIDITRLSNDERQSFSAEIKQCKINEVMMEFATSLVRMLPGDALVALNQSIETAVAQEIKDELFNLFYASEIQPEVAPSN